MSQKSRQRAVRHDGGPDQEWARDRERMSVDQRLVTRKNGCVAWKQSPWGFHAAETVKWRRMRMS